MTHGDECEIFSDLLCSTLSQFANIATSNGHAVTTTVFSLDLKTTQSSISLLNILFPCTATSLNSYYLIHLCASISQIVYLHLNSTLNDADLVWYKFDPGFTHIKDDLTVFS